MMVMRTQISKYWFLFALFYITIVVVSQDVALADPPSWIEIARFTGSGTENYTTDCFYIESAEWQIIWDYVPDMKDPYQTFFIVSTHPEGNNTFLIDGIHKRGTSHTEGYSTIYHEIGAFYMKINVTNVERYRIIVQQKIEVTPEFSGQALLPLFAIIGVLLVITIRRQLPREPTRTSIVS